MLNGLVMAGAAEASYIRRFLENLVSRGTKNAAHRYLRSQSMTAIDAPHVLDRDLTPYGLINKKFCWDWFVRDLLERESAAIRLNIDAAHLSPEQTPNPADLVINDIPAQFLTFLWRNDCRAEAARFAADIWARVRGQKRWSTNVWIDVLDCTIAPDGWTDEHRQDLFARVRKMAGR